MRYVFSLCLLLYFFAAMPQETQFSRLHIGNGLSQNSVLAIAQDYDGFLWFGTRDGLNKYDSYRFTVHKSTAPGKGSISDSYVTALLSSSKNTLWVGTRNGLNKYHTVSDTFSRISLATPSSSDGVNKIINCIYEDRKGRIWVGTDFAVKVLTENNGIVTVSDVPLLTKKLTVRCIYQDHTNIFWIGTPNGIIRVKEDNGQFVLLENLMHRTGDSRSLSSNQVMSIIEDHEKNIWVGTLVGGLNRYDRQSGSFIHFFHNGTNKSLVNNNIRKLAIDGKNNLWIGTQEGISILNTRTEEFDNHINDPWNNFSLSHNSIHSLYEDKAGTIWIGTFFGGANSIHSYNTPFTVFSNRSTRNRLNNNVISSIIEDERANLWIGTEGGGVNYIDLSKDKTTYYTHNPNDLSSLGSNLVKVIYRDKDDNIWIGTHGGGLNLFNKERNTFTKFLYENHQTLGSEITCLLEDSQNNFWVGTETLGIKLFKKDGTTISPINDHPITSITQNSLIISVLESSDKKIWIGGNRGLYIIDKNRISIPQQKTNTPLLTINCILEDTNGNIWVGTGDHGLLKYDRQGKLSKDYNGGNGLANNNVLGILEDDENMLWISTGDGLYRFNIDKETFNRYTEADGLMSNVFNLRSYHKSKSGKMFFGGYNGFISFFPKEMNINNTAPSVYITALRSSNDKTGNTDETQKRLEDVNLKKEIKLRYDQNLFTIDFAALNYIKASKNKYQYRLKGYDKEWNETETPSVAYSNVPPGNYRFMVKGANNDNVWSKETTLDVTILPPFWKTWWAYALYLTATLGFVFLITRYFFLKALYKKNQKLTQLKLNFFTNISHEIRTHLSLIIGPADKLIADNDQELYDKQQLMTIKNNSESLLQLVNELMDFRKAETGHLPLHVSKGNIVSFIQSILSSFQDLSIAKNIRTDLISAKDTMALYFDKDQLEKVFYNLIANAFKFTPQGNCITVKIEDKVTYVVISVINYGKGISKENIGKLFDNYFQENEYGQNNTGYGIGLALSKSIVELHGGKISVTSESNHDLNHCTCFTVQLPKGKTHFSDDQLVENTLAPIVPDTRMVIAPYATHDGYQDQATDVQYTLLLVEDNKDIRTFIKQALQYRYKIVECENGLEGWEVAVDLIPDLIVSDLMMPEMDGFALCEKIKCDERTSHIPFILLTAKNTITSHISGLQTGADIYLTKPFSVQILLLHTVNLLKTREALWKQFSKHIALEQVGGDSQTDYTGQLGLHPLDEAFISKIIRMIEEKLENPEFGVSMLSKMAGMSQPILSKKIRAITGFSTNDFVKSIRLKKAAELLRENRYTVYEISYTVGYDSPKYFSREFKKQYHSTPSEYAADKTLW